MKAVWSLWTKPLRAFNQSAWWSSKHHLLAWVLSLETVRKFYPETALYTDEEGARVLIDGLGLDFGEIHVTLDHLEAYDENFWTLGKLYTYRDQTSPFVHLDSDIFLWKRFPEHLENADVFTQSGGPFVFGSDNEPYQPHVLNAYFEQNGGTMPEALKWYISVKGNNACCCGLVGGTNTEFISAYADQAIDFITRKDNQQAWQMLKGKLNYGNLGQNILSEEYFLMASVQYRNAQNRTKKLKPFAMDYLFDLSENPYTDQEAARRKGFTHLISGAKRNAVIAQKIERRVKEDYPQQYEKCVKIFENHSLKPILNRW